eukprot:comp15286_c0_seq1/m.12102 comp15286_c0_seq1/g.12102  ORF comp15286_c0_seq1/g.12102 comp15286_c0_seq1/m.12102 type:complete len:208 (-) comp15286_c0_seq1:74-697(-)
MQPQSRLRAPRAGVPTQPQAREAGTRARPTPTEGRAPVLAVEARAHRDRRDARDNRPALRPPVPPSARAKQPAAQQVVPASGGLGGRDTQSRAAADEHTQQELADTQAQLARLQQTHSESVAASARLVQELQGQVRHLTALAEAHGIDPVSGHVVARESEQVPADGGKAQVDGPKSSEVTASSSMDECLQLLRDMDRLLGCHLAATG